MEFVRCMSLDSTSKDTSRKRKAASNESMDSIDPARMASLVKTGEIADLKLPHLKEYLRYHNLSLKGRKAEIVERIVSHINGQSIK